MVVVLLLFFKNWGNVTNISVLGAAKNHHFYESEFCLKTQVNLYAMQKIWF